MKLVRFGPLGEEVPGLIDAQGRMRNAASVTQDYGPQFFAQGGLSRLASVDPESLPLVEESVRLGPCIARPHKFLAIGLNYTDHAEEAGLPIPDEPLAFMKATSCISGPNDAVEKPAGSEKLDWEVEIALVIGQGGVDIPEEQAAEHIAGYCIVNDITDRGWQFDGPGQWTKGKSFDGFGPVGPYLVTPDTLGDPTNLDLWLDVDGVRRQTGTTSRMIFSFAQIIAHLSSRMRLEAGDLITTGTPPGVGLGHKPPLFLSPGQTMTLGVSGLGEQTQTIKQDTSRQEAAQ